MVGMPGGIIAGNLGDPVVGVVGLDLASLAAGEALCGSPAAELLADAAPATAAG